ncbi:MAG: EF-hand domain-containing protein [Planctomycetia bacterium]|nr:EF-hand domain-containing protein [Planctomycetia bacterium]
MRSAIHGMRWCRACVGSCSGSRPKRPAAEFPTRDGRRNPGLRGPLLGGCNLGGATSVERVQSVGFSGSFPRAERCRMRVVCRINRPMTRGVSSAMAGGLFAMAVVVASPVASGADKPAIDPEKVFKRKDADGDGKLSLEEFKAGLKEKALENADRRFKRVDTDGDGTLSLEEFKAGMKPKPAAS